MKSVAQIVKEFQEHVDRQGRTDTTMGLFDEETVAELPEGGVMVLTNDRYVIDKLRELFREF